MGHRKKSAPRHGSLGVRPRKRASRIVPRIKSWPDPKLETPTLLAFPAYKAGMTHVIRVDDRPKSPTHGKGVFTPVTVLEAPPVIPLAIRAYIMHPIRGLVALTEAWTSPPEGLEVKRKIPVIPLNMDHKGNLEKIRENLELVRDIRVLVATQPKLVGGLSKKKPDILEVRIGGGSLEDRLKYAEEILGKQVSIKEVFKAGMWVDVIAVSKGRGFGGVIQRFGVKEIPRWHKHRKGSRKIGSRSPGIGALSTTPQAGQMGFHRRTEYNKRVLMIGENGEEITPRGGFVRYGIVKSEYVVLEGSVPGPKKRIVILRYPVRSPPYTPEGEPKILYVNLESQQGV